MHYNQFDKTKKRFTKIKFSIVLFFVYYLGFGQLVSGSCVHGEGISYLLNAYLASVGACRCERSGVLLTSFQKCETGPFVLEFEDNFDGDSLDLNKWELPGGRGALQGSQNVGVYTLNNITITGGSCLLTGKREIITARAVSWEDDSKVLQDGLPNLRTFDFTSGMIKTKRQFFYGKYEVRCRMPSGKGFWPAFWTFGGKRWNEIDFFDNYAGTNEFVHSLGHDYTGSGSPNGCNFSRKGYDFTKWHTITCVFDYDKMDVLIDGESVRTVYRVITPTRQPVLCGDDIDYGTYYELMGYPMEPMNILLNLALMSEKGPGGSVPIDESTPFPSSFEIDYVRFWKRVPALVNIYPNPCHDKTKVFSNTLIKSARVCNLAAQTVFYSNPLNTDMVIDLSDQPDGVYILNVGLEGTSRAIKIVKISP